MCCGLRRRSRRPPFGQLFVERRRRARAHRPGLFVRDGGAAARAGVDSFRLTRELEAPLEPVGARRVLTSHLETTLRTLRRQPRARAPLLGLLEAFVREPVLDWLRGARHDASLDRDADDVEAGAAAAPERAATARGNCSGRTPATY